MINYTCKCKQKVKLSFFIHKCNKWTKTTYMSGIHIVFVIKLWPSKILLACSIGLNDNRMASKWKVQILFIYFHMTSLPAVHHVCSCSCQQTPKIQVQTKTKAASTGMKACIHCCDFTTFNQHRFIQSILAVHKMKSEPTLILCMKNIDHIIQDGGTKINICISQMVN